MEPILESVIRTVSTEIEQVEQAANALHTQDIGSWSLSPFSHHTAFRIDRIGL